MSDQLGTLLLRARRLRPEQLDQALRRQAERGGRLGTNLVELGFITLDALAAALAAQRGVPSASIAEFQAVTPALLALVPAQLAARLLAFPLRGGTGAFVVAMASPWELATVRQLAEVLDRSVVAKVAPELRLLEYLEKHYGLSNLRRPAAASLTPRPPEAPEPSAGPFGRLAEGEFLSNDEDDLYLKAGGSLAQTPGTFVVPAQPPAPAPQEAADEPIASPGSVSLDSFGDTPAAAPLLPEQPILSAVDPEPEVELLQGELILDDVLQGAPEPEPVALPPAPSPVQVFQMATPPAIAPADLADPLASVSWGVVAPELESAWLPPGPSVPNVVAPEPAPHKPESAASIAADSFSVEKPSSPGVASDESELLAEPPPEPNEPAIEYRPVASLYLVEDAVARSARPEKVVENLLWACEGRFEAAVFFLLEKGCARPQDGFGPAGALHLGSDVDVNLGEPSLVRDAQEREVPVLSASAATPVDRALCQQVGAAPSGPCAAVPFLIRGAVVGVLWASCGQLSPRPQLGDELERLHSMGARALGRMPWGFGRTRP